MSVTVKLWSLSKTTNSTKVPTSAATKTLTCVLKDNTSVLRPQIESQTITSPWSYNYAQITDFNNRYYFIEDYSYYRGVWTLSLVEDVLGTYKTSIGNSWQLITRSAAVGLRDQYLLDTEYPATSDVTVSQSSGTLNSPFVDDINDGTYVIGVTNKGYENTWGGSVSYYCMTNKSLNILKAYLMEYNNWSSIDSAISTVQRFEFNPLQYIVSCNYFPIAYTSMPRTDTSVTPAVIKEFNHMEFGWWDTPAITVGGNSFQAWALGNKPYATVTGSVKIPKHPNASTRGKYLNLDPYSRYTFIMRPFGEIVLDSTYMVDMSDLYYSITFDAITGDALLELFRTSSDQTSDIPFATYRACICTPVQIAQITQDLIGTAQGVAHMVESAFMPAAGTLSSMSAGAQRASSAQSAGKILSGAGPISSIIDGTISAVRSTIPQVQSTGTSGSYVEYSFKAKVIGQFFSITEDASSRVGYPSYDYAIVSTSSGFTLCKDVKIELAATNEEIDLIKQFMEAGFYYE